MNRIIHEHGTRKLLRTPSKATTGPCWQGNNYTNNYWSFNSLFATFSSSKFSNYKRHWTMWMTKTWYTLAEGEILEGSLAVPHWRSLGPTGTFKGSLNGSKWVFRTIFRTFLGSLESFWLYIYIYGTFLSSWTC